MKESEKEAIRQVVKGHSSVMFIEGKEKEKRNGLFCVMIEHKSKCLPNKYIKEISNMGYIVSCIVDNHIYFERSKVTF